MAHKTLVNGTSYEISGGKTLVNGTAYSISGGKTLVGGTAYNIGFGTPIGNLAVGSSVYAKYTGTPYEFLVVHQGLPDATLYDSSCDGTWLVMKNIFSKKAWDSTNNDYENSDIKSSLDSMYIYFDINSSIKQVKLPYQKGTGSGGSVSSGTNGLSSRMFLLSAREVGYTSSMTPADGVCLDYFAGLSSVVEPKRIAYYSGSADYWWLRSASTYNTSYVWMVNKEGQVTMTDRTSSHGFRPAMILPSSMSIDENFNVIA